MAKIHDISLSVLVIATIHHFHCNDDLFDSTIGNTDKTRRYKYQKA